jgi:Dolichyl-phosphate-mannose-protein mannosyltransferase
VRSPLPAAPTHRLIRIFGFALVLLFVTVSGRWPSEHLLPWTLRLGGTLVTLAGAFWFARSAWWGSLYDRIQRQVSSLGRSLPVGLALLACALSAALMYIVLEPFPHIEDEAGYYFQARVFALGRLFANVPVFPEFFPSSLVMPHEGRWFSVFPPGWPLLLAAGMKAGAPALVNPFLTGLCVLVIYELVCELYGRRHAIWSAVLCCLSPFFLFMGGSFMSHTALLLVMSLSTLCFVKAIRGPRSAMWLCLSGVAAGAGLLIRPPDAVAIWGAQTLYALWVGRFRYLKGLAFSAGALAIAGTAYLTYNRVLVGHWGEAPLLMLNPAFRMGFGSDIGVNWETFDTPGHNPWRALINLNFNAAVMSQDLFGWPLSSLFFVIVFWVFGTMTPAHRLSATIVAGVVVAYGLFWYHGVCFGARFYFCLLPHLLVFTIDGIRELPRLLAPYLPGREPLFARGVGAAVLLWCLFGWLVYVPKVSLLGPYHDQRGINASLYEFVRSEGITSGIVFVQAPRIYLFSTGFIANELPLGSGRILYALDRGTGNKRLIELFPGRPVYRFAYQRKDNPYQASLGRFFD